MTDKKKFSRIFDNHIDCFGEFNCEDLICRKKCSVAIKCNIEKNRTQQILFSDEIFGFEDTGINMH